MPICFKHLCFNAPYHFTVPLNLRHLILSLTPCDCFICIYLFVYFLVGMPFLMHGFLINTHFSGPQLGRETRPSSILNVCMHACLCIHTCTSV